MSDKMITIGYWDCRARVGILSLLLDYCKIPYKLRLYPSKKFDEWGAKHKDELGADFPNLPYLINGDKIVTESLALIKYIANLAGRQDLLGKNLDDQTLVDSTLNVAKDVFDMVDLLCYTKNDFETEKNKLFSAGRVKDKLTRFNKFLEGKEWICGYLTVADFYLFEDLEFIHDIDSSKLEPYPNLVNLYKRFLKLPEVQAHRKTDNFIARWLTYDSTWTNIPEHNEKKSQDKVVVWYMSGRVLGQITRHLIAYCKVPHEEKRYANRGDWEKEKETLGFDFPNLPFLIHGDLKLTESLAVYEYIPTITGHHELNGLDDSTKLQIKVLTGVVNDLKTEVHKLIFSTPKETFAEASEKSWTQGILKDKLTRLNKYLGNKEYLCGKITVVDFVLFSLLEVLKELDESKLNEFSGLFGLYKRFTEIPEIKSFTEAGNDVGLWVPPVVEGWVKKNE